MLVFLMGCDAVTRHKVLSTIFDGVPSLPPPEQLCSEYVANLEAGTETEASAAKGPELASSKSTHLPYRQKKCNDCHDKQKEGGLIRPKAQLCAVCHESFQGAHFHGPVAAGDCLACHEPHSANFPSLLKADNGKLCGGCHRESRLAATMHAKLTEREFGCVECHDPHAGKDSYFLK